MSSFRAYQSELTNKAYYSNKDWGEGAKGLSSETEPVDWFASNSRSRVRENVHIW